MRSAGRQDHKRGADFDVQLLCFCAATPQNAIGFFQAETHRFVSPRLGL